MGRSIIARAIWKETRPRVCSCTVETSSHVWYRVCKVHRRPCRKSIMFTVYKDCARISKSPNTRTPERGIRAGTHSRSHSLGGWSRFHVDHNPSLKRHAPANQASCQHSFPHSGSSRGTECECSQSISGGRSESLLDYKSNNPAGW